MNRKTPCQARGSRPIAPGSFCVSARASVNPRLTPSEEASRGEANALRTGTLNCHLRTALGVPQHTRFDVLAHWGLRPAICSRVGFEALHAPGTDENEGSEERRPNPDLDDKTPWSHRRSNPDFRSFEPSKISRCALFPARAASVIQLVIPGAGAGPAKARTGKDRSAGLVKQKSPLEPLPVLRAGIKFGLRGPSLEGRKPTYSHVTRKPFLMG